MNLLLAQQKICEGGGFGGESGGKFTVLSYFSFSYKTYLYFNSIIFKPNTSMSRCQHCQKITLFCLHDHCTWRQAGGCPKCFKKYHDHSSTTQTLTDKQLQAIYKKTILKNDMKVKCRTLQDAVSSYFAIMKTQMSSSIDAVSRVVVSKLSHPFLYKKGQLSTYKKIKNKEYKKISKKELTSFYNFTNQLNLQQFQNQEKTLYLQEVEATLKSLKLIDQALASYSQAIFPYDPTFKIQKSFLNKTIEISNSILQNTHESTPHKKSNPNEPLLNRIKEGEGSESKYGEIKRLNLMGIQKKQSMNDRGVSIDVSIKPQMSKFSPSVSYRENELKIQAEKKKLLDLLDGPKRKKQTPVVEQKKVRKPQIQPLKLDFLIPRQILQFKKQKQQVQSPQQNPPQKSSQTPKNQLQYQNDTKLPQNVSKPPQFEGSTKNVLLEGSDKKSEEDDKKEQSSEKKLQQKSDKHIQQSNDKQITSDKEKNIEQGSEKKLPEESSSKKLINEIEDDENNDGVNLFANLLNMGINFPQMIMHTILPRAQSQKKLYENTEEVKEKKIVIPVKQFENNDEISSPLLKKRKKNQLKIQIKRVEESESVDSPIKILEKEPEIDDKLELKEKQANSLALLIQSLPLPAEKAIPLLQTSIKYSNNNLSAAQYLSYLYLEVGKPKQCLDLCNQTLQQMEDSPQYHQLAVHISNNKAAALNILGRYSESISILQKCIQYYQQDIFYKNLADAYFSIGIYEKAIYNYETALHMNDHLDQAHYNMSVCLFLQQNFYHAEIAISKALKLNPENQNYIELRKQIEKKLNN